MPTPIEKRRGQFRALFLCIIALFFGVPSAHAELSPANLRCEYRRDPLAIDTPTPRLFWIVTSRERGEKQTAYHILVASTVAALNQDKGDLWNTGKVISDETTQMGYAGKPLRSAQQVFWKVRVWDASGEPSAWSRPATWTMGLLEPSDWSARWITPKIGVDMPALGTAQWIWFAGDGVEPPAAERFFRGTLNLPAESRVAQATMAIAVDDNWDLAINGKPVATERATDSWREYRRIDVSRQLRPGLNTITIRAENLASGPAGLIARLVVRTSGGQEFVCVTDSDWKAATEPDGSFVPVRVIGANGIQPWGTIAAQGSKNLTPPPYFRKTFAAEKTVRRALLYATALGVYELSLNGKPVSDDVLSPGWTDYRKRVHYLTYDVTKLVRPGQNAIGAILGDGWYASYLAFTGRRDFYGGNPKLRLQLDLEYTDGTHAVVGTDGSWKTRFGAIRSADMLMGTRTDTRAEMPGWNTPNFAEQGWSSASVTPDPGIIVDAQTNEPIRVTGQVSAKKRTEPRKGVFIYDMGQNMVGWVRLRVSGKPGQIITVRHGERLNPDGTLYTTNLRTAQAADTYILKGGKQTLEPAFTFHGFQYVEITGDAEPLETNAVVGRVANSDLKSTLAFGSDNPLLNKLVQNIDWGFRGNALDVPTDCPQRDERAGWMGDAQVFAKTSMFHRDAAAFYTKWLMDVRDGQFPDGSYPDVAPSFIGGGNAAWEDAGVICVYRMWEMYGDTRLIEQSWPSMVKYMDHLAKVAPEGIRSAGAFGDWLLLAGPDKSPIHGTAYYFRSAQLMAVMADAIGRPAEAEQFRNRAAMVRAVFNRRFVTPDGKVVDDNRESQTFYALALDWKLIETGKRPDAARHLTDSIREQGGHLTTGFIGTPLLLTALAGEGKSDVANTLLLRETYPSWLYQVKIGATTMWERWDGWTPEKGFQDAGMNSFNHYWLGCVGEWVYSGVGGIDTDGPAWSRVTVRPQIVGALKHAQVRYDSLRGPVESKWAKGKNGELILEVIIPANTTATIHVPARTGDTIEENGKPVAASPGVATLRQEADAAVFTVSSGRYRFKVIPKR
ncbi:MAG: family 78 glycoside hydrolase catalytic domain [Akkermansiaceae bacterium]|nr:family 78 glycoside hydrolase catalytic domain [Armatimonadota bacterium]